jgi:DNA excision repair protein ERCC-2
MGVPYQYTESRILKARLEFLRETYRIKESDFLSFDAMRHAAQCLGRVIRGKDDYGIMVLADKRFNKRVTQLPKWIQQGLDAKSTKLSIDQAVGAAKNFLKEMSSPWTRAEAEGHSSWSLEDLQDHQRKRREMGIDGADNPALRALEGRAEVEREDEEDEFGGRDMDAVMADVDG